MIMALRSRFLRLACSIMLSWLLLSLPGLLAAAETVPVQAASSGSPPQKAPAKSPTLQSAPVPGPIASAATEKPPAKAPLYRKKSFLAGAALVLLAGIVFLAGSGSHAKHESGNSNLPGFPNPPSHGRTGSGS
jgi:hypothetical protein